MTRPPAQLNAYWGQTHKPLANLAFIVPLLLVYEAGVALIGTDLLSRSHIHAFLAKFDAGAEYFSALLIVVVLVAQQFAGKHPWRLRPATPAIMALEAAVLAVPLLSLGLLLGHHSGAIAGGWPRSELARDLLSCVGAGIYEEFLFRLAWLAAAALLLVDLLNVPKDAAVAVAVFTSAAAFALYHFVGAGAILWGRFAFLLLAGAYLAGVYLLRGYGVAVGVHVAYNMMVLALRGA
ncbi:MAG: CPBP family intramembrane metalloprotease [Planctomycetes bacterium]|nr:CPBP family intramembrane metalloprotease [Planctomycetota bacterium]